MIDVLFLKGLQRDFRFPQDFVLPRQQLGAKIIALAVVHERLVFGGSIILQLFQGQPICRAMQTKKGSFAVGVIQKGAIRQQRCDPNNAAPKLSNDTATIPVAGGLRR